MWRRGPALAALVLLAGCGGTGRSHTAASVPPPRAPARCPPAVVRAVDAQAHARVADQEPDVVVCEIPAGREHVRVTLDDAPQAAFRFSRGVVERGQAALGGDPRNRPVMLDGVGEGADWIPGEKELLATAGTRLVTVDGAGRAEAVRIARAALAARAGETTKNR